MPSISTTNRLPPVDLSKPRVPLLDDLVEDQSSTSPGFVEEALDWIEDALGLGGGSGNQQDPGYDYNSYGDSEEEEEQGLWAAFQGFFATPVLGEDITMGHVTVAVGGGVAAGLIARKLLKGKKGGK